MSRMRFAFTVFTICLVLVLAGGNTAVVRAFEFDARALLLGNSLSESTVLLLFGSCLWGLALLRRLGGQRQNA
jgi:hypothetical protein